LRSGSVPFNPLAAAEAIDGALIIHRLHDACLSSAVLQLSLDNVWFKALYPEGGASGVGESICHYIQSNHNNMLVIGNRGEGGFKRAMSAMLGLGSVSEYCAHNAACPVIVYKN